MLARSRGRSRHRRKVLRRVDCRRARDLRHLGLLRLAGSISPSAPQRPVTRASPRPVGGFGWCVEHSKLAFCGNQPGGSGPDAFPANRFGRASPVIPPPSLNSLVGSHTHGASGSSGESGRVPRTRGSLRATRGPDPKFANHDWVSPGETSAISRDLGIPPVSSVSRRAEAPQVRTLCPCPIQ